MASFTDRNGRIRALVRQGGFSKCATFATRAAAEAWVKTVEREIDEIRSTGVMTARGQSLADLIDRYVEEIGPRKRWGRTKEASLAKLKREIGHLKASNLTAAHLTTYFTKRARDGAGRVTVSAEVGYLIGVLETARSLWHLNVPVAAATSARDALKQVGMVGKSKRRDRRVSDAELERVIAFFVPPGTELDDQQAAKPTALPMPDILRFCMASAMRISEVCRLQWRDLDVTAKTIIVRDRKHPDEKWGNDMTVPLLAATGYDAFAIVMRQPRRKKDEARIFPYDPKTISSYFTKAVSELEMGDLHLHDIRHEAISRLFAAGYRIEQVALVSGHRDWAMLRRYTHVRAEDLHRHPTTPAAARQPARRR